MIRCRGKRIYKDIAPYYDRLMYDVSYEAWVKYIKNICSLNRFKPEIILDLGCGTGNPTKLLLEEGYMVIGIDGSPEMLAVARQKLQSFSPLLLVGEFNHFSIKKKVDLVISLFDSLNNLLSVDKLHQTFLCVNQVMQSGGLFIFDINSIYGLSRMNESSTFTKECDGVYSIWKSQFDKGKILATLAITLFVSENGHYRRMEETHMEKGYSTQKLKQLLKLSGFGKVVFYEHLTFRRPTPRTQRLMVVALKN